MKIVNLDGFTTNPGDLSWEWIGKYGEYTVYDRTSNEKIIERAKDAEILFLNKTPISSEIIAKLPKLKYVGLQSTGFNIIDCEAAKDAGIIVTNIPDYSSSAVAQATFALILELTNQVALHSHSVHIGDWCDSKDFCYWKTSLTELQDKTIGIIGFGKIGRKVAEIAECFGLNVLAYSPTAKENNGLNRTSFASINEILSQSDIVSIHCPLNKKTEGLINSQSLSLMKKSAFLINTSRGPVVDEKALADALNNGTIAGAGLDVLSAEPCERSNPLLNAKNCFITPHIAWAGLETRIRLMEILEKNLKAYLDGNPINVVNK